MKFPEIKSIDDFYINGSPIRVNRELVNNVCDYFSEILTIINIGKSDKYGYRMKDVLSQKKDDGTRHDYAIEIELSRNLINKLNKYMDSETVSNEYMKPSQVVKLIALDEPIIVKDCIMRV